MLPLLQQPLPNAIGAAPWQGNVVSVSHVAAVSMIVGLNDVVFL